MSDRRRNALWLLLFSCLGFVISVARNVLFVPIYLHKIPFAEYGAWLATGGALALILVNDYGLSGVVTQRMSASYGAQDFTVLGRLAGSALAISVLASVLLSAISIALVPFLPGLQSLSATERDAVTACFAYAAAANAVGIVGGTAISALRSLQRAVLSGSIAVTAEVSNVVVILAGLSAGWGLYALAAGLLVRSLIMMLSGVVGLWWVCTVGLRIKVEIHAASIRALFGEAHQFFLSAVAMKLQAQANVFLVGAILGPSSAAVYSLTVRAHETVFAVLGLVNTSLVPSMTHLYGSGNVSRFRAVLKRLMILLAALSAFALTSTAILNPSFISLWVGNVWTGRYAIDGEAVSILMACALFVSSVGYIAYDAILAQGQFRFVSRAFILTSAAQVALLLLLLRFGLWTAPLISMVTAAVWGFAFWQRVRSRIGITGAEAGYLAAQLIRLSMLSVATAVGFAWLYPQASSWTAWIVEACLCGICLTICYLSASRELRGIVAEEISTTLGMRERRDGRLNDR